MSSYYHIVKKEILKKKKFLGIDLKFFYYLVCLVGIIAIWSFFSLSNTYSAVSGENDIEGLIYIGLAGGCYLILRFLNNHMVSSNWFSACDLVNNETLEENTLNYLIREVEQSVKNIKRFAEWCVGVLVTLVVLVTTLLLNIYSKLADFILKGIEDKEIKTFSAEAIKQINEQGYDPFSELINLFFQLLFLFGSFILFGYFIFSLFSIAKRQVLVTLYDIRYALLLNISDSDNS
ncbi:hypothetical protein [Enterococcus faecalis]|uniref:hypothetical protein n=1 Tax=Enterococcus faecalis TaxID=1351 RepID=UPI0003536890|nr:hypothetical protein [Enterococcus faecalis]EPI38715.1 hypothetical protein D347_01808 [Enterococcus faecalis LA3B-2]